MSIDLSKEGDPYPIILWMRNPVEALKEMLSNPANSTGFANRPRRTFDNKGNRTVSSLNTVTVSSLNTVTFWEQAQVRPESLRSCAVTADRLEGSFLSHLH